MEFWWYCGRGSVGRIRCLEVNSNLVIFGNIVFEVVFYLYIIIFINWLIRSLVVGMFGCFFVVGIRYKFFLLFFIDFFIDGLVSDDNLIMVKNFWWNENIKL